MKLVILIAVIAVARSAKLDRTYLPPHGNSNSDGSGLLETPKLSGPDNSFGRNSINQGLNPQAAEINNSKGFVADGFSGVNENELEDLNRNERPQATYERNAAITRQDNENNVDVFSYLFETENGIFAEESGVAANGVQAQGGYSYTGDDGHVYSIRYTADENGFVPQGEHLPTAPPVPEEILRSLEQNARDEAAGIFDDGSYDESKYSSGDRIQQYDQSVQGPASQNYANLEGNFVAENDANTIATQAAAYLPPRRQFQRKPAEGFESNGNDTPAFGSTNGISRDANTFESQGAHFPSLSSKSRPSQRLPVATQLIPNDSVSHSEKLHRPSSYEVPIQSRIPEQGLDASKGFGSRIQNHGRSSRPSFNSRTGYNY